MKRNPELNIDEWINNNPSNILKPYKDTFIMARSDTFCYNVINGELRNNIQSFFLPLKKYVLKCQNKFCNNKGPLDTAHNLNERKQIFLSSVQDLKIKENRYDVYKIMELFLEKHKEKKSIFFLCKSCHTKFDYYMDDKEKKKFIKNSMKIKIQKEK